MTSSEDDITVHMLTEDEASQNTVRARQSAKTQEINNVRLVQLIFTRNCVCCAAITVLFVVFLLFLFLWHASTLCDDSGSCDNESTLVLILFILVLLLALALFFILGLALVYRERMSRIDKGEITPDYDFHVTSPLVRGVLGVKEA